MSKLKSVLCPELAKYIKENFPVVKNRTALWFFTNEFKNNLVQTTTTSNAILQAPPPHQAHAADAIDTRVANSRSSKLTRSNGGHFKVSRNRILQMWKNMDPESKRKYFNMAEFDELRYKEQKSLWVSEVGALAQKYQDIGRVKELAPTHDRLQNAFLVSLDKLHKNYEQMIQTESTKMIYKDAIKQTDAYNFATSTHDLISTVPRHHGAILYKPRRPPAAFVLYLNDNMDRYLKIRRETRTKDSCMRLCSIEWANLSKEIKQTYEDRYLKLKDDYDKAMELYKSEILESSDNYLQLASREKKAFKKSLRKRLRDSSVLPLCIRNAFNFFVMDNKDTKLNDLTEIWRKLPMEKKMKYIELNQQDVIRYQREVEAYNEMRKTLDELLMKRKNKSSGPNNDGGAIGTESTISASS